MSDSITRPSLRLTRARTRRRWATIVAASGAAEGTAVALLVGLGARGVPVLACAAALHLLAVVPMLALRRGSPSRAWLCASATALLPGAGVVVVAVVLLVRGRGALARLVPRDARVGPARAATSEWRLAREVSPCDALASGDEELRRSAVSTLAERGDRESIALLEWGTSRLDADSALLAALALDELAWRRVRL